MRYQAFIDESARDGGHFALAGLIATTENWRWFSREWANMLKMGTLSSRGDYHFKMNEMALNEERMARIPWFWEVASRHAVLLISYAIDPADLEAATRRLMVPGLSIDYSHHANPFLWSLKALLELFHTARNLSSQLGIARDAEIDFTFDDRTEKTVVLAHWNDLLTNMASAQRAAYPNRVHFERDEDCLPLQAADLFAWWVRRDAEAGGDGSTLSALKGGKEGQMWLHMYHNEDQITDTFGAYLARKVGPSTPVLDRKTGRCFRHEDM